ncbi:MAG: 30S ribosomal protein S3 [Chloroflexi bacterium]|nr:30S ribosomal protein S3 [Chloroflexota bacterium]
MGQKVHPHGFRLGYIYDWNSKWFASRDYAKLLREDLIIRGTINQLLPDAGISSVEIERNANLVTVSINTARPGIVIGRGGQRVDELRAALEKVSGRKIRVNINEIRMPEVDAALVARAVGDQLERRISHRRAIKQAISRAMQRGALGIKIKVSGRLGGSDMSRKDQGMEGRVPLHTLKADIDYGTAEARTTLGRIGVKVWIYKGDRIIEEDASVQRRRAEKSGGAEAAKAETEAEKPAETAAETETPAETETLAEKETPADKKTPAEKKTPAKERAEAAEPAPKPEAKAESDATT